jgi:hypothetical protein
LREALGACRAGDTLVVTKLDRLVRSLPDARDIVDELTQREVKLNIGGSVHDPSDPIGRLLFNEFNVLAMIAEFEADLARLRTREGMKVARAKGRLRGKQPKLKPTQEAHLVGLWRRRTQQRRAGRAVRCGPLDGVPGDQARRTLGRRRVSAQAFVDESARGSNYHVCVAVIANGDVDALRRLVRSFCLPGQRRWHFVQERDSRRRQIIDALTATGQVTALIFHGKGRDTEIRTESFHRMVQPLLDRNITRLIIESREGRDDLDRQVLISQFAPTARCLWLRPHATARRPAALDSRCCCLVLVGRRSVARTRRCDHRRRTRRPALLNTAKPGRSPSGEEPGSLPEASAQQAATSVCAAGIGVTRAARLTKTARETLSVPHVGMPA